MNRPVISIIVPAYNSSKTIGRCITSIVNQTFKDWELIIVDNGSTDSTITVVKRFMKDDARISLLSEPRKGVSNARNKALNFAYGDYVCFVDSDDLISPDYLSLLYSKRIADLVVCGYFVDIMDEFGNVVKSKPCTPKYIEWKTDTPKSILSSTFENGYIHLCCNKLFKCSIIKEHNIRFEQFPVNEDYIFTMQYLLHANSVCILNEPLYHWIRVADTTTGVNSIPDDLLFIYNQSHSLTRKFFKDNAIADGIAFYSYEMIIYKYYQAMSEGRITKKVMFKRLNELCCNSLVQDSFQSYKPASTANKFLVSLLKNRHCYIYYIITRKILKLL